MSPQGRLERKLRFAEQTVLAMGEGKTKKAFLEFLKGLFGDRNDNIDIKIRIPKGGSPELKVFEARKFSPENFDRSFLLLDTDVDWSQEVIDTARKNSFRLIGSDPCIEGLFLSILNPAKDYSKWKSSSCKRELHKRLAKDKKLIAKNYSKVFTKKNLLDARKRIQALDDLLTLMFLGKELH